MSHNTYFNWAIIDIVDIILLIEVHIVYSSIVLAKFKI